MSHPAPNWPAVCAEATEHLKALLRLDTTNAPNLELPGNEIIAARYLQEVLERDGIPCTIVEKAPGRANLVARLKGDGSQRPLLLSGHTDVVPAEPEHWSYPPFAAEEANGCIYGRGTVDMKNMVAMSLMALLTAKRLNLPLKRDLIFAAVADEEAGCDFGTKWLVDTHRDLIDAEYLLTEIGGFSMHMDGRVFYPLQVAEKGISWLRLTFTGEPGHGSIPAPNSALVKAARAAERLSSSRFPLHVTRSVGLFLNTLASHLGQPKATIIRQLTTPVISEFLCRNVLPDKKIAMTFYANLHNTATPTVIRGGDKTNVVPSKVTLDVDGRLLPGFTPDDLLREIRAAIGSDFQHEILDHHPGTEQDIVGSPLWETVLRHLKRADPQGIPLPWAITGFTDAAHYQRAGIRCLGFSPVQLPPDLKFAELFHGHNERIPVAGFHFGTRLLCETVHDFICQ